MLDKPQTNPVRTGATAVMPPRDAALIAVFVTVVYHAITFYNTMNPEQASLWLAYQFTTLKAMFAPYLNIGDVFYRPTIFYVFLGGIGSLLDWHNVAGFRFVSFILMMGDCLGIYILVRVIWRGNRYAAVAAAAYFAANPSNYIVVSENFFSDTVSVLLLVSTVILFHVALTAGNRRAWAWMVAASIATFLLALTSRENAFLCPVFLFFVTLRYIRDRAPADSKQALRSGLATFAPFALLSALFTAARLLMLHHLSNSGAAYRTEANWGMISQNIPRMFDWMAHIFWRPLHDYIDVHNGPIENSVGVGLVVLTFIGWLLFFRRNRREAAWGLVECIVWISLFASLGIYAGYAPWHIFTALVGYSVLVGLGVAEVVCLIRTDRWRTVAALAALACFGVLAQYF